MTKVPPDDNEPATCNYLAVLNHPPIVHYSFAATSSPSHANEPLSFSMTSQVDARQAFTYLNENVPKWLNKLDDLQTKCDIQFQRFTRVTQRGEIKLVRKAKQASVESLRPGKDGESTAVPQQTSAVAVITSGSQVANSLAADGPSAPLVHAAQGIPRKRPAGSELSDAPSNHCRYRTKNMVVLYYDSDIQEAFESLVKSIASARNNLRKGKNTTAFKMRMASMGLAASVMDRSSDKMEGLILGPSLGRPSVDRQPTTKEMRCFEDADRDLEEAQSFCEWGAHQFLRDGNCYSQISGTRRRLTNCKGIAQREIERLKEEGGGAKSENSGLEEAAEEQTLVGASIPPSDRSEVRSIDMSAAAKMALPPLKDIKFAGTGAIEIDDDSDCESVQIDMSAIRRTVRSTRV